MSTETLYDKASYLLDVISVICEHPLIINRLRSKIKKLAQNANEKQEQKNYDNQLHLE
jgi:hypothetical protein